VLRPMSTLRARYSAVHERGNEASAGRLLTMHVSSGVHDSRWAGTSCHASAPGARELMLLFGTNRLAYAARGTSTGGVTQCRSDPRLNLQLCAKSKVAASCGR
jgi:hypothetical protein